MTFSIILSYAMFVGSSCYLLIVCYNIIRKKTPLKIEMGMYLRWDKVLVAFAIWSACGIYLWG